MARRLDKTLADYLAIAVSPVLIMTLVGSLVFFLLEVLYVGHFEERLRFIMAMFVMAAVLIGRISIEESSERAAVFALPLAIVTTLAVYRFVSKGAGPLVTSLGLMTLIWWCAHKLTWDCTLIDEEEDASGEGLLQVVGLDESPGAAGSPGAEPPAEPEGVTSPDAEPSTWRERLMDEKKRPHAPGVWIVFFSLAALPVFGLGQRFVPAGDVEARRYVFWLLCVYVASGFGLLLTTSFLGLRRYLRQRRLQMPASMAGAWIAGGCVLIVAILAFAALLPRPASEYAVSELPFGVGAVGQKSSRHAMGDEGVEDDQREPRPGEPPEESPSRETDEEDPQPDDEPQGDESGEGTESATTESEQEGSPAQGGGEQHDEASGGDESQEGGSPKEGRSQSEKKSEQTGERGSEDESSSKSQDDREASQENEDESGEGSESQAAEEEEEEEQEDRTGERREKSSLLGRLLPETSGQWLTTLFRWVLYAVLIVVGAVWLWRSWDKVRAGFRQLLAEWKAFWERLFGSKNDAVAAGGESDEQSAAPTARPFSSFSDPFASGAAARSSPDELVRYSFEALEAWARDHGWPRRADETPHEFARQVGTHATSLSHDARRLADLYCTVAYADGRLPESSADHVRHFWRQLRPGS